MEQMDNELNGVGLRLKMYLDYKRLGINEAGRILGTSGSQISLMVRGRKYGTDKLLKFINHFEDLNLDWLLRGNGNMISPGISSNEKGNSSGLYIEETIETIASSNNELAKRFLALEKEVIALKNSKLD